ncbi:Pentapeptide repeat protein [Rickettsiales bacterium Ac37b]|nr:Pentapeptide repeat protein [Rickettsiales bacterium Ac37b]
MLHIINYTFHITKNTLIIYYKVFIMSSPDKNAKNNAKFSKIIEHIVNNPKEVASIYHTYNKFSQNHSIFSLLKLIAKVVIFSVRQIKNVGPVVGQYIEGKLSLESLLQKDEIWKLLANNKDKIHDLLEKLKPDTDQIFGKSLNISEIADQLFSHPTELASLYRSYSNATITTQMQEIDSLYQQVSPYLPPSKASDIIDKLSVLTQLSKDLEGKYISGITDKNSIMQRLKSVNDIFKTKSSKELEEMKQIYNSPSKEDWFKLGTEFIDFVNKYPELSKVISKNSSGISSYIMNYYQENLPAFEAIGIDNPNIFRVLEPFLDNPAILKQVNDLYNQNNFPELGTVLLNFASDNEKFDKFLRDPETGKAIEHFLTVRDDLRATLPYGVGDNNFAISSMIPPLLNNHKLLKALNDEYINWTNTPNLSTTPIIAKLSELLSDQNICTSLANNAQNINNIIESYFKQEPDMVDAILKPYNVDPRLLKISGILLQHPETLETILKELSNENPSYISVVNNIIDLSKKSPELTEFLNSPENQKHIIKFIQALSVEAGIGNIQGLSGLILGQLNNFEPLGGLYNTLSQSLQLTGQILQSHDTRAEAVKILQNNIIAPVDLAAHLKDKIGLGNIIGQDQTLGNFLKEALNNSARATTSNDLYDILISYIQKNPAPTSKIEKEINERAFAAKKLPDIAFDNLNIKDFDFTGSTFTGGSFKNAVFTKTNFSNTVFLTKQVENPNTKQLENITTDFSGATFDPKSLQTLLISIRDSKRVLTRANIVLDNVKLSGDFSNMDLSEMSFKNADFSKAKLNGVNLSNSNLYNSNISEAQLTSAANISNVVTNARINLEDTTFLQVVNDLTKQIGEIKFPDENKQKQEFCIKFQKSLKAIFDKDPHLQKDLIELQQISQNYPGLNILVKHLDQGINGNNIDSIPETITSLRENLIPYKMSMQIAHNLFKGGEKLNQARTNETRLLAEHLANIIQELKVENPIINWDQFFSNTKDLIGNIEFTNKGGVNKASGLTQIYYDRGTKYTKAGYLTGGIQIDDLTSPELKYTIKSYIQAQAVLTPEEKILTKDLVEDIGNNIFGHGKNNLDRERIFQHLVGIITTVKNLGIDIKHFMQDKKEQIVGSLPEPSGLNVLPSLTELYYQQTKGAFSLYLPIKNLSKAFSESIKEIFIRLNENKSNLATEIKPPKTPDKGRSI